ncbi:polynucleotide adenylyltransferase [alpha proteobacterium AAP81b]|nr:polynucleotide adenylyltransferase [alpha proteobacterium AAP81b]
MPLPAWTATPAGRALLGALGTADADTRLVGGAVRDALLGHPVKDIDLATRFPPAEVVRRLEAAGLKAVPTGIAHGTVTAVGAGLVAEVTTLRRDVATDGRHAEVAFTDDWQADASRRDFTINALYATLPQGAISDFFGGCDDLAARRVRFIGDPLQRIAEDHLRILRFFRFSARFAGTLDAEGLAACSARANDLMALSRERIAQELRGLLGVADPLPVLAEMLARGIWRPVLPEFAAAGLDVLARTIAAEAATGVAPDWRRRLAALLPADRAIADDVTARLRLSNADRTRVALAVRPWAGDLWATAWAEGAEAAIDRLLIAGMTADVPALVAWARPKLPASGRDIIARGIAAGPAVAAALGRFERAWVAAGFPRDTATVATLLDRAVAVT